MTQFLHIIMTQLGALKEKGFIKTQISFHGINYFQFTQNHKKN
jgi:hypothetical protein